jgi:hypothetical protein
VHGRAVQVDPRKPKLKPSGTKRLKLTYDGPVSNFAFNFNLRRYSMAACDGENLLTVAVAPHQVYGPRDFLFLHNFLINAARMRVFGPGDNLVGWCRLSVSKPVLKAPMVSALEARI